MRVTRICFREFVFVHLWSQVCTFVRSWGLGTRLGPPVGSKNKTPLSGPGVKSTRPEVLVFWQFGGFKIYRQFMQSTNSFDQCRASLCFSFLEKVDISSVHVAKLAQSTGQLSTLLSFQYACSVGDSDNITFRYRWRLSN